MPECDTPDCENEEGWEHKGQDKDENGVYDIWKCRDCGVRTGEYV